MFGPYACCKQDVLGYCITTQLVNYCILCTKYSKLPAVIADKSIIERFIEQRRSAATGKHPVTYNNLLYFSYYIMYHVCYTVFHFVSTGSSQFNAESLGVILELLSMFISTAYIITQNIKKQFEKILNIHFSATPGAAIFTSPYREWMDVLSPPIIHPKQQQTESKGDLSNMSIKGITLMLLYSGLCCALGRRDVRQMFLNLAQVKLKLKKYILQYMLQSIIEQCSRTNVCGK